MSSLLRSLILTILLSFSSPIIFVGGVLALLSIMGYLPGIGIFSQVGSTEILKFLAVFGNGCPVEGALIIAVTCSGVGVLFDLFNFYLYQGLRS